MDLIQYKKMQDDKGTRKSTQHAKSTHGGEAGDTPCETRQFNLPELAYFVWAIRGPGIGDGSQLSFGVILE